MNIRFTLAMKYITRSKKRTAILIVGITVVLMMSIAVSIIKCNALNQQAINAQIRYGNWHVAYLLSDTKALAEITKNSSVNSFTTAYRMTEQTIENDDDALDLMLINRGKFDIMVHQIVAGRLPEGKNEIVVEDWFLKKNHIEKLPETIMANGTKYIITGAFQSSASFISTKKVRAFGVIESNGDLINPVILSQTPSNNNYLYFPSGQSDNTAANTRFVFIRLRPKANIIQTVKSLNQINGLSEFQQADTVTKSDSGNNNTQTPLYHVDLLGAQGWPNISVNHTEASNASLISVIINTIMFCILFIMIFVSMNIVVNNNIRVMGLLASIGLTPEQTRDMIIIQTLFISIISLPSGIALGVLGSWLYMNLFLGKISGTMLIPFYEIALDILVCIISVVVAAAFPAARVSVLSPLDAMNAQSGTGSQVAVKPARFLKLGMSRGRISFGILYGIKNAVKDKMKLLGVVSSIALLLAIFLKLSMTIEAQWKIGDWRQSYQSDYQIEIPYANKSQTSYNNSVISVDLNFIHSLSKLTGVRQVFYQYSMLDNLRNHPSGNMYQYYLKLKDNQITEQAKKVFELSCPTKQDGFPSDVNFIMAGISGYDKNEMEFAKKYLVEGHINTDDMTTQPIILLPKYISWYQNINVPYTNLKVGDKITLVESYRTNESNINIVHNYLYTIGGFVDPLPFNQINGVSNGFVAIMSVNEFNQLQTDFKGIMEIYVDAAKGENPLSEINKLAKQRDYTVIDNKDSFETNSVKAESIQYQFALYSIFGVLGFVMLLAVFNMFFSGMMMRKGEFAALSAIGMSKGMLAISLTSEALLYGLLGCVVGSFFGIGLIFLGDQRSVTLSKMQIIPWTHMGISILAILLVCASSSIISIFSLLKNISVQDIKQD